MCVEGRLFAFESWLCEGGILLRRKMVSSSMLTGRQACVCVGWGGGQRKHPVHKLECRGREQNNIAGGQFQPVKHSTALTG